MPLSFFQTFETISSIDLDKKPEMLANIIRSVSEIQENSSGGSMDFICEIKVELVSAKKISGKADIIAVVDPTATNPHAVIVEKLQRLTDKYPLSCKELVARVKSIVPDVKQSEIYEIMHNKNVRGDERYSSYSFSTRELRVKYETTNQLPKACTCIYNEDAVRIVVSELEAKRNAV